MQRVCFIARVIGVPVALSQQSAKNYNAAGGGKNVGLGSMRDSFALNYAAPACLDIVPGTEEEEEEEEE